MSKYSYPARLVTIISLLIRASHAEPCQGDVPTDAYSAIYTCSDPSIVLSDPTIQCDPDTCVWNLDMLDPEKPPEPCEAIVLVEEQIVNLPDLLEPCLWWQMLHGELGYLLPDQTNLPDSSPSPSSLPAATLVPTFYESIIPTAETSFTVSSLSPSVSSSLLETSQPTVFLTQSSDTPSVAFTTASPEPFTATDVTSSPTRARRIPVPLQSMLLTFVFERFSGFRLRHLRQVDLLSTSQSYDAMLAVTKAHIIANIPQVIDANLTISQVNDDKSLNEGMETIVLMGTLYFAAESATNTDTLPDLRPATVRRQVESIFEDNISVLRYIHALHETGKDAFKDIVLVYPGIVAPDEQIQASDEEESFWDSFLFNWENPLWIVVAAGISAGALGLCLVFSFTCCLRIQRRRGLSQEQLVSRKSDDTSRTAAERNGVPDDEIAANDQGDMSEIGYQASDVTSVYSYIENHTMQDDQSYSVAPSFMYPGADYDDEQSNRSVLWSVIDEATNNDTDLADILNSTPGIAPFNGYRKDSSDRMVASTAREQPCKTYARDDEFSPVNEDKGQTQPFDFTSISNGSLPSVSPAKSDISSPLLHNAIITPNSHHVVEDSASSPSSSNSGATYSSRESESKFSKMIPGFRSKRNNAKSSPTYQQLDESYGSHHSWDKELGISPSPDDLDDDSVLMEDLVSDETDLSQLAPLSSINRISSGGDNDDSGRPFNDSTGKNDDDDDDSVDSGDSQEDEIEPAQFVVPVRDSTGIGFAETCKEDTSSSDGEGGKCSEKENASTEALLQGDSNDVGSNFLGADAIDQLNVTPDQNQFDAPSSPPLADQPHSFQNLKTATDVSTTTATDRARNDDKDNEKLSQKEIGNFDEAPLDSSSPESTNHCIPTNNEEDAPPIYTLASF